MNGKGYLKSRSLDSLIRYPAKGYLKKGYLKKGYLKFQVAQNGSIERVFMPIRFFSSRLG